MKTFERKGSARIFFIVPALLVLFLAYTAEAQRNDRQVGAQQDAIQAQDRVQDAALHDGDYEPQQERDRLQTQDQIYLQDATGEGVPDQDRDRTQDRIRVDSPQALGQYVEERVQARAQMQDGSGVQVQTRTEARVAADAIMVSESMLGKNGPRMSAIAQEMNQTMDGMQQREEVLKNRSRLQLFLFGQDDAVIATMQQEMKQNHERIEEMKQYMQNCEDCDQGVTEALVVQIQNMEREQNRLQEVVGDAESRKGLFGFLFGWLQ